jgi:hypothetical protein
MRRLEHVCGTALTSPHPDLEIDLGAVTSVDATAHAILKSLEARGVRLSDTRQLLSSTVASVSRFRRVAQG